MRFFPRSPLPSLGHLKLPKKWSTIAAMAQLQLIVGLSLKKPEGKTEEKNNE